MEDGPAISVTTAQMITCTREPQLDAARPRRHSARRRPSAQEPSAAQRRAARERDTCRCRFPGCESRRVDLHHIQHWINGGRTDLANLISLCPYHHRLVHDRGYLIASRPDGTFTFTSPAGVRCPPALTSLSPAVTNAEWHNADITSETIIPAWYGERLNWATATVLGEGIEPSRIAGLDRALSH